MDPHYRDAAVTLHHGDCLDVLRSLPDNSVDAVVTDPPYGLGFMGKEWDKPGRAARATTTAIDAAAHNPFKQGRVEYGGTSYGGDYVAGMRHFQDWCQQWATECLRILKPGGHLLTFGGSRTWHRLASAVEDAGFEIRDSIAWLYGSGFPKSLDVSKAIDKAQRRNYVLAAIDLGLDVPGNNLHDWTKAEHSPGDAWWERFKEHLSEEDWQRLERAVVGRGVSGATAGMQALGPSGIRGGVFDITAAATDEAQRWQGWGTALKPAFEPIVVARKPLTGTVAATVLEHGTGALNIDACRVGFRETRELNRNGSIGYGGSEPQGVMDGGPGRWPTNVVLDEAQATELDQQTGTSESRIGKPRGAASGDGWGMTATRFFPTFHYEAKAPTSERPRDGETAHPTVKPLDLMRWLVRLVTPPGGTVLDPFAGSGTTAEACVIEGFKCITIEREADYLPLIVNRLTKPIQLSLVPEEAAASHDPAPQQVPGQLTIFDELED
jgi:site-specific DNA-methyltransferase (adenine-specific)